MTELSYHQLDEAGIEREQARTPGWNIIDGALTRTYEFDNYARGFLFAAAVAQQAESLNHHPDLLISYGKVQVSMVTHDAGGGLTAYDFELARRISALDSA